MSGVQPPGIGWRDLLAGSLERRLIVAETVARESETLPFDYALALVSLYAEKRDRRYEPAALRYLERYIVEERPPLADLATGPRLLAECRR